MTQMPRRQSNRILRTRRILNAALGVFSQTGFAGTTMDAIAAAAGVSKPTLYQYFDSTEQLFTAMMVSRRDDMLMAFEHADPQDMVAQLHGFAWRYADTVMHPDLLSLARLIIGEAQRFPEIGRAYQASGPDRVLDGMMAFLNAQHRAGRLDFDDVELAAQDLWGLILSAPRTRALYIPDDPPDRATLARYINHGLGVFLRAYSTRVRADLTTLDKLKHMIPTEGDT